MVIVILRVWGTVYAEECDSMEAAQQLANKWLSRTKAHFPNQEFTPRFYEATKVE